MNLDVNEIENMNVKIAKGWDNNVLVRAQDLEKESDYSYTQIIKPWINNMIIKHSKETDKILDIGCGCGYLTNSIYEQRRYNILGIDLSPTSIDYAQKRYPKIEFLNQDIYAFPLKEKYDVALAVMVLNNVPNLTMFFEVVANCLESGGKFIVVIPHPYFWPEKHLKIRAFPYAKESFYQFQFSTKGRQDYSAQVFYFHRPLEQYLNTIRKTGFEILYCKELLELERDNTPDILGFILQKNRKHKIAKRF